jgi:hypothetical protein
MAERTEIALIGMPTSKYLLLELKLGPSKFLAPHVPFQHPYCRGIHQGALEATVSRSRDASKLHMYGSRFWAVSSAISYSEAGD